MSFIAHLSARVATTKDISLPQAVAWVGVQRHSLTADAKGVRYIEMASNRSYSHHIDPGIELRQGAISSVGFCEDSEAFKS